MADSFVLLDQELVGLQRAIVDQMRKIAPVRTGALKRSIKPERLINTPEGIKAPIKYINYGIFPDFGTRYQRAQMFTERAQQTELNKQREAIGMAAGKDVLNDLDLPTQLNVNLDL